jgi:putative aldouronate transport system substrate-binding protein
MFEETGAGRCGIWFGPMWSSMVPASNAVKADPKAHMIAAPVPTGLGQEQTEVLLSPALDSVFCVSSKCENPEVLIKAYKWIWGQEDVNYPNGDGRKMSWAPYKELLNK